MIPTFEAKYDPEKNDGVFGISLVNDPAMKGLFVALSEQEEITLKAIDKEERILMGLVLEPNRSVYRNQNGKEFNIVFSSDTIKELSHNFFKSGFQLNSKLEHDTPIAGVTFVESWLVENSEIDKSANFGFKYPKGSWLATMKVDNDDIWNNYVKTGKVQGFSVDAMVNLKEININNLEMSEEKKNTFGAKVLELAKDILKLKEDVVVEDVATVELGSAKSEGVEIFYDGEMLESGGAVWMVAEDSETKVALVVGEYPLDDRNEVLVVTEEGKVGEVKPMGEAPAEEVVEDLAVEAPAAEAAPTDNLDAEEIVNKVKSLLVKFTEDIDAKLELKSTEYKSEIEKLQKEVVTLSEQPAAKPISSQATQVEFKDMSNLQKMQYRKANG
tara:strand:- start:1655 stop:2812 length:1158 start_codon:yes stop_codon:yes gene_type:complete